MFYTCYVSLFCIFFTCGIFFFHTPCAPDENKTSVMQRLCCNFRQINHKMIADSLPAMRRFFNSGATFALSFRKQQLKKFIAGVCKYEQSLYAALQSDLGKNAEESRITETGLVLTEARYALRHLSRWIEPERKKTNLLNLPSSSYVIPEPLGVVLIIGPWNFPVQLLLNPLVGAIAAGNCAVLKASEYAPAVSAVIKKMIEELFPPEFILFVEGEGAAVVPDMVNHFRFDHIFFTGSTPTGKKIYQMAAEQLIPVTLELGGKCPCIVEEDANLKVAARRIVQTKFANAGQLCVAPDYLLVHEEVKEKLLTLLIQTIRRFFSDDPSSDYNYGHIINEKHFDRLVAYLKDGEIVYGGKHDRNKLYIEPTILESVALSAPVMNEEIFGPVLPVIPFRRFEEAKEIVLRHPDPLALNLFTSSSHKEARWLQEVPSGAACINTAAWHVTSHYLPFGGRGNSGIGRYHGRESFLTFSNRKAVLKMPTWFDPGIKYPSYKGKLRLFKWVSG
jgi:aldehyde dehydrogenase (NAD+)